MSVLSVMDQSLGSTLKSSALRAKTSEDNALLPFNMKKKRKLKYYINMF